MSNEPDSSYFFTSGTTQKAKAFIYHIHHIQPFVFHEGLSSVIFTEMIYLRIDINREKESLAWRTYCNNYLRHVEQADDIPAILIDTGNAVNPACQHATFDVVNHVFHIRLPSVHEIMSVPIPDSKLLKSALRRSLVPIKIFLTTHRLGRKSRVNWFFVVVLCKMHDSLGYLYNLRGRTFLLEPFSADDATFADDSRLNAHITSLICTGKPLDE